MPNRISSLQSQTKAHYEAYPFDFLSRNDEINIAERQPRAFREFVARFLKEGQRVADVGCGPARVTLFLLQQGLDVVPVDLSMASIALARRRAPETKFVCASNLALPFGNGCFDAVVSDGVIHHTPDAAAAFRENARLLKEQGYMYVAVYRRHRYYYYLYTYVGLPIRWLEKRLVGRLLLNVTAIPAYFAVHIFKSRGRRSWRGARNLFFDYFVTPRATFHTFEEVRSWGLKEGLALIAYEENVGNVHAFIFQKMAAQDTSC